MNHYDSKGSFNGASGRLKIQMLAFVAVGELENDLNLSSTVFEDKYKVPKPDKENDEIVFSCARGNRSRRAAEIAFKLDYKK